MRIELVTGTTGALIARVMNHEVEAAFVAGPFTADDLEGAPVFSEELVLITPKGFGGAWRPGSAKGRWSPSA